MPDSPLAQAIGHESPAQAVSWNKRDLILYALGIGAKHADFPFVYELDPNFAAFPTYPVVLGFKGEDHDVNLFVKRVNTANVPGLPKFDPKKGVHGSQTIEVLKPLPTVSGDGWTLTRRIVGVHENKSGIIVEHESILKDPKGEVYARLYSGSFNIGAHSSPPSKFSKSIAAPPAAKPVPRDRKPDWVVAESTSAEQAVVYRLSGDYNPLHIDPSIGAPTFGGVILHGLATYGIAARALLSSLAPNDPAALRLFGVRFTSPVKPGDRLETRIWEVGKGPAGKGTGTGTVEVAFETRNIDSGKVVLGHGIAYIKKTEKAKL